MRYTPKEARRDGDKKAALLSIEDPLLISESHDGYNNISFINLDMDFAR
ncbi:unnamed protein product [Cylicostephanus goldi]|uniref:Uncharacterized protein n=1 Tax=Cylicostephanus goldi TaxID=71465 RepID=A0A3P6RFE5_CYLGO|nr:unnamed protein product [Cylicostephanus goldi]